MQMSVNCFNEDVKVFHQTQSLSHYHTVFPFLSIETTNDLERP